MDTAPDNTHKTINLRKGIFFVVFVACVFPACLFAFRRPSYNWDMLAYMAIVLKADHPDWTIGHIHKATYNIAEQKVPSKEYGYLVKSPYREKMAADPIAFYGQLPFYSVKPLYIGVVYLFYKGGFSLPMATVLPSILAYFLIGLLLFRWLGRYLKPFVALLSALLIMYSSFMISVARISTPDALSSFLLLSAFYFILEKPSVPWLFFFFLLSVFARLDNIITCFIILSFLYFTHQWQKRMELRQYALMTGAFIACYFVITWFTVRPFGWNELYYLPLFIISICRTHTKLYFH